MRIVKFDDQTRIPRPFNNPNLWIVRGIRGDDGLIFALIVRAQSNTTQAPEQEVWSGFKFETPWDMEFGTNIPELHWFTAYVGEECWRNVYEDFKKENAV